jgi:hypothetical protein
MTSVGAAAPPADLIASGPRRSDAAAWGDQMCIGLPVTAIAASFTASEWVG